MPPAPDLARLTARRRRLVRLRQVLALVLLAAAATVAAIYSLQRRSERLAANRHPELRAPHLGLTIQQSARGVTIAKSESGRPIFRLFAQGAEKMRPSGRDLLHQVKILVYSDDGVHADQISGSEFAYDELTGALSARGAVEIELQARPDSAAPASGPGPVHVEAQSLTYNVKQGTGTIAQGITFAYGDAQGSAGAVTLDSHASLATFSGGVHVLWRRPGAPDLTVASQQAVLRRLPKSSPDAAVVTLTGAASAVSGTQSLHANQLVFDVSRDQTLRRLEAAGDLVAADTDPARSILVTAASSVADFAPEKTATLDHLQLQGNVVARQTTPQGQNQLTAGMVTVLFSPQHQLDQIQAQRHATLTLAGKQPPRLTADQLDFHFQPAASGANPSPIPGAQVRLAFITTQGRATLRSAPPQASAGISGWPAGGGPGPAPITAERRPGATGPQASASISGWPAGGGPGPAPITAERRPGATGPQASASISGWPAGGGPGPAPIEAAADHLRLDLDPQQQPALAVATGNVELRQSVPGALRTTRSDRLELHFQPAAGQAILSEADESGHVLLTQDQRQLRADRVIYTPADRTAVFTGSVRVEDPQARFTAPSATWVSRPDGAADLSALGGVTVSFSPGSGTGAATQSATLPGPMLNSSQPVVVTAQSLQWSEPAAKPASHSPMPSTFRGTAAFRGNVRVMQAPNLLVADQLTLDGTASTLLAKGHVQTSFVTAGATGPAAPSTLGLSPLAARQPRAVNISARELRYSAIERKAVYQDQVTMRVADGILAAPRLVVTLRPGEAGKSTPAGLARAVASGGVRLTQPGRSGSADQASYDFAQGVIQLAGGPPSILDAEHGRITGDPLTFSLASDEIQVGSKPGTRAQGQTTGHK